MGNVNQRTSANITLAINQLVGIWCICGLDHISVMLGNKSIPTIIPSPVFLHVTPPFNETVEDVGNLHIPLGP